MKSLSRKWNKKIGSLLSQARQNKNLTQRDVSKMLGLGSGQYISNIERGRCPVPLRTLAKLVRMYKLNPQLMVRVLAAREKDKIRKNFLKMTR